MLVYSSAEALENTTHRRCALTLERPKSIFDKYKKILYNKYINKEGVKLWKRNMYLKKVN